MATNPDESASVQPTELPSRDAEFAMLGDFRLLHRLGEGAMGDVWLAEQSQPLRRRVAIKILKAGLDSRQILARFEAERQALAVMDHPGIAKVHAAGLTPQGRPYFVMEHVAGEPITDYCNRARLTVAQRLKLFITVCEAVQHAHQKGIIHRDLKPSNLLVTSREGDATPKVIDFGIAKATHRLTEHTLVTEVGMMIGTPEYMSPEQADMRSVDVDTRSDVYALGVILYELLTGVLPFDRGLREKGLDEIRRIIQEADAPRPSARVASIGDEQAEIARVRRTSRSQLTRELRGDIDWIVLKALEKERTRRYASVSDLAADIRRYLQLEPVLASPPSTVYRLRKFMRRHRAGVAASAAVVLLLVAFAVSMMLQAGRTAAERDRANREADAARQVADFLVGLFKVSNPSEARGKTITAREVLDQGAKRIQSELASQPAIQGRLLSTVGSVYSNLGLMTDADPLLSAATDMNRRAFGAGSREHLEALSQLGTLRLDQSRNAEAEAVLKDVVAGYRQLSPTATRELLVAVNNVGRAVWAQGRYPEAETLHREALDGLRAVYGEEDADTLTAMNGVGAALFYQRKRDEAGRYFRRAYETRLRVLGQDHPATLQSLGNLGSVAPRAEMQPLYRSAFESSERVLGPDHPQTLRLLSNLSDVTADRDEAQANLEEMIRRARRLWPSGHAATYIAVTTLTGILMSRGRYAEAEVQAREALDFFSKEFPAGHSRIRTAHTQLVKSLIGQKKFEEAEKLLLASHAVVRDPTEAAGDVRILITLYTEWKKPQEVAAWSAKLPNPRR